MNTKTAILILFLAAAVMTSWTAAAQGPGGRGGQGHQPPKPAIDSALDADGDTIISADEIENAQTRLSALDADEDNQLSFEECMGFSSQGEDRQPSHGGQSGTGGQPPLPPIFSALDSNGDQIISSSELADAATALQQLDKNLDGELSADEYRPQHPGGQRGDGQMRGGPTGGGQGGR